MPENYSIAKVQATFLVIEKRVWEERMTPEEQEQCAARKWRVRTEAEGGHPDAEVDTTDKGGRFCNRCKQSRGVTQLAQFWSMECKPRTAANLSMLKGAMGSERRWENGGAGSKKEYEDAVAWISAKHGCAMRWGCNRYSSAFCPKCKYGMAGTKMLENYNMQKKKEKVKAIIPICAPQNKEAEKREEKMRAFIRDYNRKQRTDAEKARMHNLDVKAGTGCMMCVTCGNFMHSTKLMANARLGWRDNCGEAGRVALKQAKEREQWTVDEMWLLRQGLIIRGAT